MLSQTWRTYHMLWHGRRQPSQAVWKAIWKRRSLPRAIQNGMLARLPNKRSASLQPQRFFSTRPSSLTAYRIPFRSPHRPFRFSARQKSSRGSSTAGQEPQTLGGRIKRLSKEYGWVAVGVYLGLSVLDFPFCFLLVKVVGTEKIGELEHLVVSNVQKIIPESVKSFWRNYRAALKEAEREQLGNDEISEAVEATGWGVKEAEERNRTEASLTTQLALAYAIHKSFIFVRVPLTAAVTPRVVKVLRSWGWQIGKSRGKRGLPRS